MNIEPADLSLESIETEPFMEETYHLVHEGLFEMLNDKNSLYDSQSTDYLDAIVNKINFSKQDASAVDAQSLDNLLYIVNNEIIEIFKADYADFNDLLVLKQKLFDIAGLARLVYYFFYFNKSKNVMAFLVGNTLSNRKKFQERFKKDNKKDLTYSRLKAEMPDIKNPANIYIVMSYQEIAQETLTSNVGSFSDMITQVPLTFEQTDTLMEILGNSDDASLFTAFIGNLVDHPNYNHFLVAFKDELATQLLNAS